MDLIEVDAPFPLMEGKKNKGKSLIGKLFLKQVSDQGRNRLRGLEGFPRRCQVDRLFGTILDFKKE